MGSPAVLDEARAVTLLADICEDLVGDDRGEQVRTGLWAQRYPVECSIVIAAMAAAYALDRK